MHYRYAHAARDERGTKTAARARAMVRYYRCVYESMSHMRGEARMFSS